MSEEKTESVEPEVLEQGIEYSASKEASPVKEKNKFKATAEERKPLPKIPQKPLLVGGGILAGIILLVLVLVPIVKRQMQKTNTVLEGTEGSDNMAEEEDIFNDLMSIEYTEDEIEELRKNGYTGDEIEKFEAEQKDAKSLIDKAKKQREALYEKEITPYYDKLSPEVKKLRENSWLGQNKIKVSKNVDNYTRHVCTLNVDYEKLDATGFQCFLKIKFRKTDEIGKGVAFLAVDPERYVALTKTGNIILEIEYTETGKGVYVITSMNEISY